jgi:hypothetical protein
MFDCAIGQYQIRPKGETFDLLRYVGRRDSMSTEYGHDIQKWRCRFGYGYRCRRRARQICYIGRVGDVDFKDLLYLGIQSVTKALSVAFVD